MKWNHIQFNTSTSEVQYLTAPAYGERARSNEAVFRPTGRWKRGEGGERSQEGDRGVNKTQAVGLPGKVHFHFGNLQCRILKHGVQGVEEGVVHSAWRPGHSHWSLGFPRSARHPAFLHPSFPKSTGRGHWARASVLTHGTPRFSSERVVRRPESHGFHVVEPDIPPRCPVPKPRS